MAARRPHGRYHLGAQLVGELAELFGLQLAEVGGDIHRVEQRRMRNVGHRAVIKPKIGRASCRESVCQYVSVSVVAVSLKKQEHHICKTVNKNTNISYREQTSQ